MNKLTHEDYLQKLKEKDIKTIPLEKYKGSKTKKLHKCTCGNEWIVRPDSILAGRTCGHNNSFNNREKYIGRKTILYYIKIGELYKIGLKIFDNNYKNVNDHILRGRYHKSKNQKRVTH